MALREGDPSRSHHELLLRKLTAAEETKQALSVKLRLVIPFPAIHDDRGDVEYRTRSAEHDGCLILAFVGSLIRVRFVCREGHHP